jgi:hypothetical protein
VAFFLLAGVSGTLGIAYDRRKWLAVLVASIVGGFLLLMWLWKGFA